MGDDAFPHWLAYVEASADLGAVAAEAGLGDAPEVEALELLEAGGVTRLLAYLSGDGEKRLAVLDPDTLEALKVIDDERLSPRLSTTSDGFTSGIAIIDPDDLTIASAPAVLDWNRAWSMTAPDGGAAVNLVFVEGSETLAWFYELASDWTTSGSTSRPYAPDGGSYYPLRATAVGDSYALLARRKADGAVFMAAYGSATGFSDPGITYALSGDDVTATGPFPAADDRAWPTVDGPVAYHRSDDAPDRLIRYRAGSGGGVGADATLAASWSEALDSITIDDDAKVLGFDASGSWWFAHDRLSGRLYKLRTWWR